MIKNDNGLFIEDSTNPPTLKGYIFNFQNKEKACAFAPDGKMDASDDQIKEHNRLLAEMEWKTMLERGKGVLYVNTDTKEISDWPGINKIKYFYSKQSFHNMAGQNGRTDVWFNLNNKKWHGINIGDNQILRVKVLKK